MGFRINSVSPPSALGEWFRVAFTATWPDARVCIVLHAPRFEEDLDDKIAAWCAANASGLWKQHSRSVHFTIEDDAVLFYMAHA